MSEIKRYARGLGVAMQENAEGGWVRYDDVKHLLTAPMQETPNVVVSDRLAAKADAMLAPRYGVNKRIQLYSFEIREEASVQGGGVAALTPSRLNFAVIPNYGRIQVSVKPDPKGPWMKVEDHAGVANENAALVREVQELSRQVEKLKFEKMTENNLPSQFQIGDWVNVFTCDAISGIRFNRAPGQIKGVHFTESKVSYDVEIGLATDLTKGTAEPTVIRVPSELVCAP